MSRPRFPAAWPRAVISDLDGTLVDSAPDIAAALNAVLAEFDIVIDAAIARRCLGDGARRLVERVLFAHGHAVTEAQLDQLTAAFNARYRDYPCHASVLFPGTRQTLATLRTQHIRLAICTNKPQPIADQVLTGLDVDRYFDAVIGAGRYPLKPDPAALIACLDALACHPEDAVYIGDMAVDRAAGHAAGLPVLLAEFGYARAPVAELGAEGVFAAWPDLPATLAAMAGPD